MENLLQFYSTCHAFYSSLQLIYKLKKLPNVTQEELEAGGKESVCLICYT